MATEKPLYFFDEKLRRYRDAQGRFVPDKTVVREIESFRKPVQTQLRALGSQLLNKQITYRNFETQMQQHIKQLHTAGYVAAKGGWAQMSPADWGKLGAIIKGEYKLLNNFVRQVRGGQMARNGRIVARAGAYANPALQTYENAKRQIEEDRGKFDEGRRLLSASEHCNGCRREADRQWVPIRQVAPIGSQECGANCKCRIVFRKAPRSAKRAA